MPTQKTRGERGWKNPALRNESWKDGSETCDSTCFISLTSVSGNSPMNFSVTCSDSAATHFTFGKARRSSSM